MFTFAYQVLIPGRCLAVSIYLPGEKQSNIMNLYNFGLTRGQELQADRFLRRVASADRADPSSSFSLLVGDVIFVS